MYEFVDRRVTDLGGGGQLLICAMRIWVMATAQTQCPTARLAPAFVRHRIIGTLPLFNKAMTILNRDGLAHFSFGRLCCPLVSEDEAILLAMFGALSLNRSATLRDALALLVNEDAVAPLHDLVIRVSIELARIEMLPVTRPVPGVVRRRRS